MAALHLPANEMVKKSRPRAALNGAAHAQHGVVELAPGSSFTSGASPAAAAVPAAYVRLMLTSLGAGYLCVDENYVVTDANSVALKWLGMRSQDVVGRPYARVVPKSPMKMLKSAVERSIFVDRELFSYGRPDRLLDLHVYPIEGGAIVFFRDLTEQKCSRQNDAGGEALLRSLDAIPTHVVVLDRHGTVIGSNLAWRSFAAAHGLTPQNDEPLNYLALHDKPLADRPEAKRISAALSAVLTGSVRAAQLEYAWRLDGTVRSFALKAERFECDGNYYLVVANEDVTALKEAEQTAGELCDRLLAVQEEERQRIAGELHDCTAQHLVALGLNLIKLKSKGSITGDATGLFAEMDTLLQEATTELRTFTYLLHPPQLAEHGLLATLQQYVEGFSRRTGVSVMLRTTHVTESISAPLQRCIYRIVQEGLANVHRHASATRVKVDLRHIGGRLHLVVTDNGRGIEPTSHSLGVGLPGIRSRLHQFGGRLNVGVCSRGTRLHAAIPLGAKTVE